MTRVAKPELAPPHWSPEQLWGVAGRVLGQTALLGALLLFFGWARTRATFAHFGIDVSQLNLATSDYILRSVNTAYDPLLRLGLVAFAAIALHEYLKRTPERAGWVWRRIGVAGLVLLAIGGSALLIPPWSEAIGRVVPDDPAIAYAWLPATLSAAFGLLAYVAWMTPPLAANRLLPMTLVGLVVLSLFWTVSLLARYDGIERAKQIEHDLPTATQIVLLSEKPLAIGGPGIKDSRLADGKYRFSYAGLRLLVRADGKYFLVPSHWRQGRDRVFAVPDGGDLRVEMIAPVR